MPTQRCGRNKPIWSLLASDYADAADANVCIAGSYQVIGMPVSPFAALAHLPDYDGLHLIDQPLDGGERGFYFFLRHGGQAVLADPSGILVDDLQTTLRDNAGRLRID